MRLQEVANVCVLEYLRNTSIYPQSDVHYFYILQSFHRALNVFLFLSSTLTTQHTVIYHRYSTELKLSMSKTALNKLTFLKFISSLAYTTFNFSKLSSTITIDYVLSARVSFFTFTSSHVPMYSPS